MPVELSPYAESLLRALTGTDDPGTLRWIRASELTDYEFGVLLPAAHGLPPQHPASGLGWELKYASRERQPVYTAESCEAMFAALAERLKQGESADPVLAVNALLRCEGPWPERLATRAGSLVRALLARGRFDQPYALLALAGLAGGLTGHAVGAVFKRFGGPIAREEAEALVTLGPPAPLLVAELCSDRATYPPPQLPDGWQRLAAVPGYAAFALRALEAADTRVAEIQSGRLPYVADKAFTRGDVEVLGRAVRVALVRDEPWLAPLLDRLLPGIAVAPIAAKTLPSQALLYEVARAAIDFPTPEALAALRAARGLVRHKGVPKQLDRKLKQIERGLADRAEVAFRLPDLGFGPDGVHTVEVGGHQAMITIGDEVDLVWQRDDGKRSATVPAAVRRDHADEVKRLRDLAKRARGHLTTLTRALEAGFTTESTWPHRGWRDELATHPLGWSVVRRLIWEIEVSPGRWQAALPSPDGSGFHDVSGAPVAVPGPEAPVRLWHPLRAEVEEVRAWRDLLTERQVRQPFKQAFREIYLLTPAEEETATYSNRFAAHIVHYKRLYALVKGRGWTPSNMLGPWDSGDEAQAYGVFGGGAWRAAWHHRYLDQQPDDVECAGTDRVWFERRQNGAWREAALADVPAVVFSEAMRDVDLFVSVTSIATDPAWFERPGDPYTGYWHDTSFGILAASARVRRDALARLVPRLKIAGRCSLTDRYLVVRGDLRTYKIHLGSANILMEPDDAYLCIVPARHGPHGQVFLPFEDDRLALILSKAFLLADDARITDESILRQLKPDR